MVAQENFSIDHEAKSLEKILVENKKKSFLFIVDLFKINYFLSEESNRLDFGNETPKDQLIECIEERFYKLHFHV